MSDYRHLTFKHPFTALCAGPTSSGKTVLIRRMLQNKQLFSDIDELRVLWAYGINQKLREHTIFGRSSNGRRID
ncbi:hypothetical protein B4U80_06590 [Leptotrombidium deliense]|uniref:Uncharacterized protein n=1 Tax=Leptotrombidium deliense TaxID=299467 RepID=A0A443S1A0_9ACAR|nr:hypothetical protein B4U80_06590 [Leptotrombidium deliense]